MQLSERVSLHADNKFCIYNECDVRMKEIKVGGKTEPVKKYVPKVRKASFFSKMVQVVTDDIRNLVLRKETLVNETPEGWEDYQRFVELARKK